MNTLVNQRSRRAVAIAAVALLAGALAGAVWAYIVESGPPRPPAWTIAKMVERAFLCALMSFFLYRFVAIPARRLRTALVGAACVVAAWVLFGVAFIYRDMARRHDAANLLFAASDARKEVGENFAQTRSLAGPYASQSGKGGQNVRSVRIDANGGIRVRGTIDGDDMEIALVPTVTPAGALRWTCGVVAGPQAWWNDGRNLFLPPNCRRNLPGA